MNRVSFIKYRNEPITPFCDFLNDPINPTNLSCNSDRTAVAYCNLIKYPVQVPEEYQVYLV